MTEKNEQLDHPIAGAARTAAWAGGVSGLASLALVIGGETVQGPDEFMEGWLAALSGWLGFASACLLVLAIAGTAARFGTAVGVGGRRGLVVMQLAAAVTAGAAATLPLVVTNLVDRAPEIVNDPPAAVPATFIASGLALGVSGIVVAVALRRAAVVARGATTFLLVASVISILPLPSRYFLVCFAVAVVLGTAGSRVRQPVAVG